MEYIGEAVNGFLMLILSVLSWYIKRHMDKITEREAELQTLLAEKEEKLQKMLAEDRRQIEEMRQANNRGTQALLRDRLLQAFHFFMKRGVVTYGEAKNFENMYQAYHALGKNGVMESIYKQFLKIPVKTNAEVYPEEPEEIEEVA